MSLGPHARTWFALAAIPRSRGGVRNSGRARRAVGTASGGGSGRARPATGRPPVSAASGRGQRGDQDRQGRTRLAGGGHPGRRLRRPRGGPLRASSARPSRDAWSASFRRRRRRFGRGRYWARSIASRPGRRAASTSRPRPRSRAAEANAIREKELAEKQISSNREREIAARRPWRSGRRCAPRWRTFARSASTRDEIHALEQEGSEGTLIPLRAPIDGTVIKPDRHARPVRRAFNRRVHDR